MKDAGNLHQKVQELCDCFATTDPLHEMSKVKEDADTDEAALKWIALAILHGINSNAKEISIVNTEDTGVTVTAKYREAKLPSPGEPIAEKIIKAVREITHLEDDKGKTILALGIHNSSMELQIKSKHKGDDEKITIKFP